MSNLEEETKPLLLAMMSGENRELSANAQHTLARWVTMKAMVGEHAEKGTAVTPAKDRKRFMECGEIPGYSAVYIGLTQSAVDTGWLRISKTISFSKDGPSPPLRGMNRNMQSISILCGPLFFFIISIREKNFVASEFLTLEKLLRVYPRVSETIKWPPEYKVTDHEKNNYAYALDKLTEMKNVKYGGRNPP
jgi:hypothetical protein